MKTIERLKQLLAKATPGPWSGYIQDNDPYGPLVGIIDDHDTPHDVIRCAETSFDVEPSTANVNLMAETRNALPALLAVVEAAEELKVWTVPGDGIRETVLASDSFANAALDGLLDALRALTGETT